MQRPLVSLLSFALTFLILFHTLIAPYTKVEESFHIQAIHDILTTGIPTSNISHTFRDKYDHFSFPGSVPRSFVGALVLSGFTRPVLWLMENTDRQLYARACLGLLNASAIKSYASGVRNAFGTTAAVWYLGFQISQFHIIYYASRTLSNMFAFGITTLAMRSLLPEPDGVDQSADRDRKRCRLALCLLTIAGIIFRAELALFLATNTLFLFLTGRVSIKRDIVPAGLLGLLVGLTTTVLVDSFFWQSFPLWPELSAFTFNIVSGQSAEWGTSPWHFYFTSAIPRLLLNPFTYLIALPVSLLTPSTRRAASSLLIPSLAFVAIYSFQPHKEWRFIIYTIPPLTGACALGAAYIWTHRAKSLIYRLLSLVSIFSVLLSLAISTCILLISSTNYPGALALHSLHDISTSTAPEISVYLGNLACQTGVTRFLETPAEPRTLYPPDSPQPMVQTWHYDKTEDEAVKSAPAFWDRFEYILVEGGEEERVRDVSGLRWEGVKTVGGFGGVKVLRPGQEPRESEGVFMSRFVGVYGYRVYEGIRGLGRSVTRGWWVEVRMEPKIKILRRIDR